jgi:hypothetical protein
MNTNLDINLIRSFSKENLDKPYIKSTIENKDEFVGFSGRFSQRRYILYIALELEFDRETVWIVFGNGWKPSSDYIYIYDQSKKLIIEKALSLDEFNYLQKPTKQDGKNDLRKDRFREMNGDLNYQLSYPKTKNDVLFFLKEIYSLALMKMVSDEVDKPILENTLLNDINVEINDSQEELYEGGAKRRLSNYFERNPKLRVQAIRIHGLNCTVCGFNFYQQYGSIGKNFIEVHHIVPISTINEKQIIDPKNDLVCVCANCHRMLHREGGKYSIEELKIIINSRK